YITRRSRLITSLLFVALATFLFTRAHHAAPRLHVYVHYDYLVFPDHSDAPDPEAIQLVIDAYAAHGIDLVIDSKHAAIPAQQGSVLDFYSVGAIHMCTNGNDSQYSLQAQYFHPTSNHEWHYAVFGDYIGNGAPDGGC